MTKRRNQHVPKHPPLPHCHVCGKLWAPTRRDIAEIAHTMNDYHGNTEPIQYYPAHGGWHYSRDLTHHHGQVA